MLDMENKIAKFVFWTGITLMIAGLILGFFIGRETIDSYFGDHEQIWSITITFWVSGLLSGIFFIALAEIIEQLHKINLKLNKEPDENDLELLND
ncbi:hypothetical protein D1872_247770 [compost metagenome]